MIEHALDALIDCTYLEIGHEEFCELNEYYSKINKGNADKYWNICAAWFKDY